MTGLKVLSLFSGIGGLDLGLERAGMTVVGQVEIDEYCRRVLAKHWPDVPRHDDVRTAADWWLTEERPDVDVICGGFPCQDISNAGRRAGIIDGERSSLWSFMADTVRQLRPRYVVLENVAAILVRGLDVVAADLAAIGYDLLWDCLPAAAVGAPHRRDRWFGIAHANSDVVRLESVTERRGSGSAVVAVDGEERHVADAPGEGLEGRRLRGSDPERGASADVAHTEGEPVRSGLRPSGPAGQRRGRSGDGGSPADLADTDSDGRGQGRTRGSAGSSADGTAVGAEALAHTEGVRRWPFGTFGTGQAGTDDVARYAGQRVREFGWAAEPDVGRVADGVPARVDRLRGLGNAVVPQVSEYVGRLIVEHASAA